MKRAINSTKKVTNFVFNDQFQLKLTGFCPVSFHILGHFKKGHHDHGHKLEKKGDEEEKKTKFFDEDGDEAHDEKKGNNCQMVQLLTVY